MDLDGDDNIYQVPPPARASYTESSLPLSEQPEEPPPILMPKKGQSFRVASAALDVRNPTTSPKPAPRNVSHKATTALSSPLDKNTEKDARSSKFMMPRNAFSFEEGLEHSSGAFNEPIPSSYSTESLGFSVSQENKVDSLAGARPIPKPRSNVVKSSSQVNLIPSRQQTEVPSVNDILNQSPFLKSPQTDSGAKDAGLQKLKDFSLSSSMSYPDADNLEIMWNKELNEKYDFTHKDDKKLSEGDSPNKKATEVPLDVSNVSTEHLVKHETVQDNISSNNLNNKFEETSSINLGDNIFGESNTDGDKFSLFESPVSNSSDSAQTATIQKPSLKLVDLSDLDPLWKNKPKPDTSTGSVDGNKGPSEEGAAIGFMHTNLPASPSHDQILQSAPQISHNTPSPWDSGNESWPGNDHVVSKPSPTTLLTSETSGCQEPMDLPPPLPKATENISLPKPPPVPPRPVNSPSLLRSRPDNLFPLPIAEKQENESKSNNIFDELPTPQFSAGVAGADPFAGSEFDYDCFKFNTRSERTATPPPLPPLPNSTALPTPPSPSTKPKVTQPAARPRQQQNTNDPFVPPREKTNDLFVLPREKTTDPFVPSREKTNDPFVPPREKTNDPFFSPREKTNDPFVPPREKVEPPCRKPREPPTPPAQSNKPKSNPPPNVTRPRDIPDLNTNPLPTPPPPSTKPREPISNVTRTRGIEPKAGASAGGLSPYEDPERISKFVVPPPGQAFTGNDAGSGYDRARPADNSDSESGDEVPPSFEEACMDPSSISMDPRRTLPMMEPPMPKKNIREGFLSKQGGFNANKGWRKRWVVFDGVKLSYYTSNKSQVSKRIIPVHCIKSVEMDIKADSFRFKLLTSLKNRVFVFASDKLDDCTMWAQVLMAAIMEQKHAPADQDTELPPKPDKEGFIRFNNQREHYVTITGQMLRYYQSVQDFQAGSPVHEIDMKLASVKHNENKKLRLQLWVHYGHFELTFPSEQETQQWRLAMEDAIAEGLADDTVLTKVYENLSNQQCADCGAENPHWASINLGIVVCKNCAGVHRMFDFRVTRIKSLRMDTRVWTPSLVELMVTIGNANANMFWAAKLSPDEAISPTEMMERRKDFITKKYLEKRFADKHPLATMKPALGEELINNARADNLLETMRVLFSGADVMYRSDATSPTAFELTKEGRQRLVMEFLYQNGGDPKSVMDNAQDENRLREDIRLEGFLNKTGPVGKTFERRWCVLEHGALTYYLNEHSTIAKGAIDRKDMVMISSVETDRIGYQFELSTTVKENRSFLFSSDIKDDSGEWMRTIAKLMAPVAVMEHVGMIDIKFAGYAYMREVSDEWRKTFLSFSWRILNHMNRDLKLDYLDLRKASSIRMQEPGSGYNSEGVCFVISFTGRPVYIQAALARDTEKMFNCLQEAISGSGSTLSDQVLTSNDVPVIVDSCITHVEVHGLMEEGIYRKPGQNSRIQALLEEFRKDARSVSLAEHPLGEVADTLKRFLKELDDSVFERNNYEAWISAAGCQDVGSRLSNYEYLLKKMPMVNFNTLKRIILHLHQVSEHSAVNKMTLANLASCFAPSLMRTNKDQTHHSGDVYSKEIKIIIDLLENKDFYFHADEQERIRASHIQKAQQKIMKINEASSDSIKLKSVLVPCQILDKPDSVNLEVTERHTATEAMDKLMSLRTAPQRGNYAFYEMLFGGCLVRPIFPKDIIAKTTQRWMEFDPWIEEDIRMSLSLRSMELLEKLDANYNHQSHGLQAELQYSDMKSKKFKPKTVRFKQYQLSIYNKAKDTDAAACWNVEDLSFYIGAWPKRDTSPPSKNCLTFLVNGEKYTKAFGHCLCFNNEEDLYNWASVLYAVQNPDGLLSWLSVRSS